jgi:hypothetical protein
MSGHSKLLEVVLWIAKVREECGQDQLKKIRPLSEYRFDGVDSHPTFTPLADQNTINFAAGYFYIVYE